MSLHNDFDYSFKNALMWQNFLGHCREAKSSKTFLEKVKHGSLAALELLPGFSQVFSLVERKIVLNYREASHKKIKSVAQKLLPIQPEVGRKDGEKAFLRAASQLKTEPYVEDGSMIYVKTNHFSNNSETYLQLNLTDNSKTYLQLNVTDNSKQVINLGDKLDDDSNPKVVQNLKFNFNNDRANKDSLTVTRTIEVEKFRKEDLLDSNSITFYWNKGLQSGAHRSGDKSLISDNMKMQMLGDEANETNKNLDEIKNAIKTINDHTPYAVSNGFIYVPVSHLIPGERTRYFLQVNEMTNEKKIIVFTREKMTPEQLMGENRKASIMMKTATVGQFIKFERGNDLFIVQRNTPIEKFAPADLLNEVGQRSMLRNPET